MSIKSTAILHIKTLISIMYSGTGFISQNQAGSGFFPMPDYFSLMKEPASFREFRDPFPGKEFKGDGFPFLVLA